MNNSSVFESLEEPLSVSVFEQLVATSAEHTSVREEERKGIAREIHDDLGQALIALGMNVSLLKQKLMKTTQPILRAEILNEVQGIETQIDSAMVTLHRVIASLRPESLTKLGLRGAIEFQAHEFQVRTGIPVHVQFDSQQIVLRNPAETNAVFHIFQELLTNIGRHSLATRVEARIKEDKGFFHMQVKDNGRGISRVDLIKATSFGLIGLKERVFLLHGDVDIQGVPDKGTTVTVRIPTNM